MPQSHQAALVDLGPLQRYGDAVGEDDAQNYIVEQLVRDHRLAEQPEPVRRQQESSLLPFIMADSCYDIRLWFYSSPSETNQRQPEVARHGLI